ncbi:MAG: class I SAM-dependent methyltransferase [Desulfovibrio sp.]|jgi:2-polyprenyl-3-methyl-5-hydroxy-6-metoxy-1,4-benzoquinol methylase|nr:class I SAM-dependent methyltransferase [Desulfovibrio sp.]
MNQQCWCGRDDLHAWNTEYTMCRSCGTLIDNTSEYNAAYVENFCNPLYDQDYWYKKMLQEYQKIGCKNFDDVILYHFRERAAYWMHYLLKHLLPPATVIEIGCGVGTFAYWLRQLGFDVTATELNPAWRSFVRKKLAIEVSDYQLSSSPENCARYDAVFMMDVFEHLANPLDMTAALCNELKEDGIIMLQMPQVPDDAEYSRLLEQKASFLRYLLPGEHVRLYTVLAARRLMMRAGFRYMLFYPSIFHDDMFFIASRRPLKYYDDDMIRQTVLANPHAVAAYAALENFRRLVAQTQKNA